MTSIPDEKLYEYAGRVREKVVLITGAANGIGKEAALEYGSRGGKVVIGDLDVSGAEKTVAEIRQAGGQAISAKCNVVTWDDQVSLYELAIKEFGSVDIVVANAGISESSPFHSIGFKNGKPVKPNLGTFDVNITGAAYTAYLAQHYLKVNRQEGSLKILVLMGSMASWQSIPLGPLYTASKHAILGLMRSIHPILEAQQIRVACVHSFFVDTLIVPIPMRLFLAGIPRAPIKRVAGAIFYASTDPTPETNGSSWCLLDNGNVFLVPKEEFKMGVYGMMDQRANSIHKGVRGIHLFVAVVQDLWLLFKRPLKLFGLGLLVAAAAYVYRGGLLPVV